ncbi:MAG: heavy metal-binding domain-containing protein [Gemmatimonas sp.]
MPSILPSQAIDVPHNMTTTGFELPGYRIVASLGVVRGVVVRSRSVFGTFGAGLQTLMGGNITIFTELAERTRQQAFDTMLHQAHLANANAVIGIRYDANELMKGVTEVLCYGTAVLVRPAEG